MISLFVMYSCDRIQQLKIMIRCLEEMEDYESCQKILVVDGPSNYSPAGWEVVEVPRKRNFNWSSMWAAGVSASIHENIIYLDSDRILPTNYFKMVEQTLGPNKVLFCGSLFNFKDYVCVDDVISMRDISLDEIRDKWEEYKLIFDYDPRWKMPLHGPGKGPCSGNMAFTKTMFLKSGGVDPWYEGHGAYADTDFHLHLWEMGVEFVDLDVPEFHLKHPKLDEELGELAMKDIEVLSLNNFVYHSKKWGLGYTVPKAIAAWLNLPSDFVDRVLERIESGEDFVPLWT